MHRAFITRKTSHNEKHLQSNNYGRDVFINDQDWDINIPGTLKQTETVQEMGQL